MQKEVFNPGMRVVGFVGFIGFVGFVGFVGFLGFIRFVGVDYLSRLTP